MSKRKVWPIFLFCHRRCTQYNPYIYTLTQWLCLSDESTDALSWILMFASFLFFVRVSSQAVEFLGTVIFKNCYYICSLPLSMLLTIHPWILRDNELWFCAFNSLSVSLRLIATIATSNLLTDSILWWLLILQSQIPFILDHILPSLLFLLRKVYSNHPPWIIENILSFQCHWFRNI